MIGHLYTMVTMVTYNFISLKTSFLCYYKPHLPKIYFAYTTWTSFRDPTFDFEFESIDRFRLFYFTGY